MSATMMLAAAASIIVALMAGWWAFTDHQAGWEEFRTGSGERGTLQLGDGSVVHLNARSRIALRFSASSREIRLLDGEALFEVRHDARRPFRVATRDTVIEDIGTRFNVYSREDGVHVAVIEGSVEVTTKPEALAAGTSATRAAGGRPVHQVLKANQEAQIERGDIVALDERADISQTISWPQRRLIYRKESLAHIVADFNRNGWHQIQLEGEAVQQRPYTGVFDPDDPDSLAEVLAQDPELEVERSGDSIVVRARTTSP
jgi:transmembrane sensor